MADLFPRDTVIDFSSAPPNLTTLGNNTLFTHWRPKAHFIAPNSWMNDPMTLWYKADGQGGGKFKASYQAHPNHVQWGNISQASAVSDDLIHWKDVPSWKDDRLTLYPSQPNDRLGVFDGTMISKGYKGFPTLIYTGVKYLPTGWTIPYTPGTESQNLAWTEDGGVTWHKLETNPVIGGPPVGMNITAWRDPWLFQSPTLERLTASNPGTPTPPTTFNGTAADSTNTKRDGASNTKIKDPWFATVSGGEKGVGPHLLLYRQASEDFTKWVYLGQIFQHAGNYTWSEWSGNWGWNFEVSTVLRLGTEGDQPGAGGRDFICMGTEGGRPEGWSNHWPLWVKGSYSDQAQLNPEYGGVVDWGETYAFMSFPVPREKGSKDYKNQPSRQILFGWTYEDDNGYGVLAKGWQGAFTLPREMFVKQWTVQDSRVDERGSWGVVSRSSNSVILETLGTRPAQEVSLLMSESKSKWTEKAWTYKGGSSSNTWTAFSKQPKSRYYVLTATLDFANAADAKAGFTIYKSPDGSEQTHIFYDFATESIRVDRSQSSVVTGFNLGEEVGKFRLWNVPKSGGKTTLQSLELKVFVDNSIVEIYANDVFAMTTRIYPWRTDSVGLGYYTSGSAGSVAFSKVQVYEGLTNAWPDRPANTSNNLVWDGPNVPWPGW